MNITHENSAAWGRYVESLGGRLESDGDIIRIVGIEIDTDSAPVQLAVLSEGLRASARRIYAEGLSAQVDIDGVMWQGDYDDVQKLDAARRLASEAGQTEVTFYDATNAGHTFTIAEATALVIQLGSRVQQLIAAKQAVFQQIDAILVDSETSDADKVAALEALA